MDQPRGVGRPVKFDGVGQAVILERMRAALRERPRADLQRQELAKYARVTPALISYYFPDRSALFTAAAQPVIDKYIADLRAILGSNDLWVAQLRSLTSLLVHFNFREGYLIDFYLAHSKISGDLTASDRLNDIDEEIIDFFGKLPREQRLGGECAHMLQSTLWGMCKHVAYRLREKAEQEDQTGMLDLKAELICDCFINGVSGPALHQDVSSAA